jgi:hypothetical protein
VIDDVLEGLWCLARSALEMVPFWHRLACAAPMICMRDALSDQIVCTYASNAKSRLAQAMFVALSSLCSFPEPLAVLISSWSYTARALLSVSPDACCRSGAI